MAASEVTSFETNLLRIAGTSEAETLLSGNAECVLATFISKGKKILSFSSDLLYVKTGKTKYGFNTLCSSLTCDLQFQVTGSGKTLAFLIPVVEILLRRSLELFSY